MVKIVEQYLARLSEEEHKKVREAAEWLFQNGYIKSKSKLAVTRYALFTLVNIVNKKKAEQEIQRQQTVPAPPTPASQTAVVVPQTAMPTTTPDTAPPTTSTFTSTVT